MHMAGKYECEGQLDLFSFLKTETREPPILLESGQPVYLVNKADVIAAKVTDNEKSWVCGENNNNRGYRLIRQDGGYGCTWNDDLGKVAFTKYNDAREKADEYLKTHDGIILAKDIKPISTVAYSQVRGDGKQLTAFYCDLGNGMYYIKEFITFHHICKGKNADKAIKRFMQQQEFKNNKYKDIAGYVPSFKNMYKCTKQSDWDYAECGYSHVTG